MEDVAERVGGLEAALEMFILNTDRRLAQADAEAAEREERRERAQAEARMEAAAAEARHRQMIVEMKAETARLKADTAERAQHYDQMIAEMKAETAERGQHYDQMIAEMKAESAERAKRYDQMIAEMKADNAKTTENLRDGFADMRRHWHELADRMGTIVEDIVAPNIRQIAREKFGCEPILDFMVRRWKRHPVDPGRNREFDVVCVGENVVVWNETKCTVRQEYPEAFVASLPEFFEYSPEYQGRELIPVFAAPSVPPSVVTYLTRHGVYAMAMAEGTMQLLNFDALNALRRGTPKT